MPHRIALFALICIALPAFGQAKVGVVDLDQAMAESQAGKQLQTSLQELQAQVQADIAARQQELDALRQQLADGAGALDDATIIELQMQLEQKTTELKRFYDDQQRAMNQAYTAGLLAIEEQLGPILEAILAERGLDAILRSDQVLVFSPDVDITGLVVERLDAASE